MKYSICALSCAGLMVFGQGLLAQEQDSHGDANAHMNQTPFEELAAGFESPERAAWQKPDEVIAALGDLRLEVAQTAPACDQ